MLSMFKEEKINGFHLGTATQPELRSASIGILIPVGSRHEADFPAGIAHFFEHMIYKGTQRYNARALAQRVESKGCNSNAYTSEDHTLLEFRGPASECLFMLQTAAEMLWDSNFPKEEIEQECQVIEEEILGYRESPSEHIFDLASQSLWGNQPLGSPITGSPQSIQEIDQAALIKFQQQHYTQEGIVVAVAGGIDHDQVAAALRHYFPKLSSSSPLFLSPPIPQYTELVQTADIEQCHLCLSSPTLNATSPERHTLRLFSLLLGETMGSHLVQKLREELGLCYTIHSDFSLFHDTGVFQIYAGVDASRFDFAREQLYQALSSFTQQPPSDAQIAAVKHYAISQNSINLEGSQPYMQWIVDSIYTFGRILIPRDTEREIAEVNCDKVRAFAVQQLDPKAIASALIRPH